MKHAFLLVLLAGLLLGCAQNAILEITITLPTSTDAAAERVEIGFQPSAATDPASLATTPGDQRTFDLPPAGDAVQRVSVVASAGDVELPLWLSVRYCSGACPLGEGAPIWVRYERPFYTGEFTEHDLVLPLAADPTLEVGVCDVYGCQGGARVPGGPCIFGDGVHACAAPPRGE